MTNDGSKHPPVAEDVPFRLLLDELDGESARLAASQLQHRVRQLAAAHVPPRYQDEVTQRVLARLVDHEPSPVRGVDEGYVVRMLQNATRDLDRARLRQRRDEASVDEPGFELQDRGVSEYDEDAALAACGAMFEAVLGHALATRQPQHRPALEATARQLYELVFGTSGLTMDQILEDEAPGADGPARKQALDRVLQRHSRARQALEDAVEERRQAGVGHELEALLVKKLLRRQKTAGATSEA